MAKFKVKFKIQALELEIEGERDAVPQIAGALKQQVAALLTVPQAIAAPNGDHLGEKNITPQVATEAKPPKRRSTRTASRTTGDSSAPSAIDFRHDPSAWGNPKQTWNGKEKSTWLLFVSESQGGPSEMPGTVIAATFNKHFRQAGLLVVGNVNRDLGVAKGKSPSIVGEDTTKTPHAWFLTDEGKNAARKLVADAKGIAEPA